MGGIMRSVSEERESPIAKTTLPPIVSAETLGSLSSGFGHDPGSPLASSISSSSRSTLGARLTDDCQSQQGDLTPNGYGIKSNGNIGSESLQACPRRRSPSNKTDGSHRGSSEDKEYEVTFAGDVILNDDGDSIVSSLRSLPTGPSNAHDDDLGPPDGGWGWAVVLASLIISMIADGISFSFGLLYIEFLDYFGASKSRTAWIGSLFMSVPLLSGPVMSALVDRYGCRTMTIIGGLVSGTGFVLSSMMPNIEMMFVTFGVLAGLGLGMCYVTAVVCIAYWFDKKRTLATGLGACGTGIGTFVYAPLTQYFIENYGWRGTVLLLAGTLLNMCVCGCVMRDPEWWTQEQQNNGPKSLRGASSCGSISVATDCTGFPGAEELRRLARSGKSPEYVLTSLVASIEHREQDGGDKTADKEVTVGGAKHSSVVNLPTFIKQSEKVPLEVLESLSANKKLYNVILENYPSLLSCRSLSENQLQILPQEAPVITRVPLTMSVRLKRSKNSKTNNQNHEIALTSPDCTYPLLGLIPEEPIPPILVPKKSSLRKPSANNGFVEKPWLKRQCSLPQNHHYLRDIKLHRNSVMYRGAMLNIHKYRLRASSCPDIYRNSMTTIARENEEKWYSDGLELVKGIFDFSMFLELHFLLMSVATCLLFIWFIVPYFYIAEHMTRNGYSEDQAAALLSLIGITNTIGMVGLGWAGDQPWMNVTKTYAVCLVLCGIAIGVFPLVTSIHWLLMTSSALFGLFFASSFSFTPVILVELIPLDRFTTAYGLSLLCQGIGNLVGPPLAGWIFDITGTWDLSFYISGVSIAISGLLIGLIPMTRNRRIWGSAPLEKDVERDSVSCA